MIIIRNKNERGHSQIGWLNSFHTFSFAEYYDPNHMGFGSLRVINEDTVQPGYGFGTHPHNNMEIISYVVEGALEHKDSMGTGSIIKPGEIQRMSAGSGIQHSEFNHSDSELLHFLQIWIIPQQKDLHPSYEQKTISKEFNKLILIGSPNSNDNAITIHQNVNLFVAYQNKDNDIHYEFEEGKKGWLQVIKGKIVLNKFELSAGDGAAISEERKIQIKCIENAEFLLFDLGK